MITTSLIDPVIFRLALHPDIRPLCHVTGCSQFVLNDAEARFGLGRGHGKVIFNGVSLTETIPPRTATPSAMGQYVSALGRVVEKKGFDLLLHAWAEIADQQPDVILALAGDGPKLPELRRLASSLGIARQN